jgi:hypothetical protein
MTSKSDVPRRVSRAGILVASVAVALVVVAAAMAVSAFRRVGVGEAASQVPSASASATAASLQPFAEQPLPVPPGDTVVAVLDPAVESPAISADEAIALARATVGGSVGQSPYVQLVRMTASNTTSPLNGWTGWVILSTDVPSLEIGGGYFPWLSPSPAVAPAATFTWVWVGLDGKLLESVTQMDFPPDEVPPLP